MAEIRVEKRKSPIWPWILGVLAIILVAFLFLNKGEVKEAKNTVVTTVTDGGKAAGMTEKQRTSSNATGEVTGLACIDRFSSFVNENKGSESGRENHKYTHDGLKYLSCSLKSLVDQNNLNDADVSEKTSSINQATQKLQEESTSDNHIRTIQTAINESVDVMEALQKKSYPDLKNKVAEVRKAAKDLETKKSTLEQKDELNLFFQKADEVMVSMRDKK